MLLYQQEEEAAVDETRYYQGLSKKPLEKVVADGVKLMLAVEDHGYVF